ncbi:phosphatidate cytidylyltransferase [Oricola thermophila]|uniref:Phosphatidate cytidylyltransferase n=1 Tax=Oricola thermophila TaxID=2742145 RepID=A0A6N1VC29_9HYPH|nr:phosphatidate cytidylyltransferase [Oricola thermophila]QKV18103.1 phosphatidate cytidylyltransferase [Oricola thermophila]
MSNLQLRTISALVLGVLVLGATLAGGILFAVMATAIAMLVWHEWMDIACPNEDDRIRLYGFLFLGLIFLSALLLPDAAMPAAWIVATAAFAALSRILAGGSWPVAGFLYSGTALVALIMLRANDGAAYGLVAILFLYAVVWLTDIGAYFAGRHFGGPKLAPSISPNKTWSGAIGGLCSAVVAAIIVSSAAGLDSHFLAGLLAAVLSVASQAGDLFESWLKRRAGVKDSSKLIPGHGGMMDRVDGLVFAAIILWLLAIAASGSAYPSAAFFGAS